MATKSKIITDLIDRLEMKIEVDQETPELLSGIQHRLDALEVLQSPSGDKEYQYALELQALIYGRQGKDAKAQRCIDAAVAQAGSPKKLRSQLLRNYVRAHPANAVAAFKPIVVTSAAGLDKLSGREQKFMRTHGLEDAPDIAFFIRKPAKFLVLALCTGNIYAIYWFYRNWRAVRDTTGQEIRPFWRAIFYVFYAWPLFKMMILQGRLRGFPRRYSGGWLALGYIFLPYFALFVPHTSHYLPQAIISAIITSLVINSLLLTAQQAAVFNNAHLRTKTAEDSPRGKYELLVIIVGVLFIVLTYVFTFRYSPSAHFRGSIFTQFKTIVNAQTRVQTLTLDFDKCATDLESRRATVDVHNQAAVAAFNADYNKCVAIHQEQIKAINAYYKLTGVRLQ